MHNRLARFVNSAVNVYQRSGSTARTMPTLQLKAIWLDIALPQEGHYRLYTPCVGIDHCMRPIGTIIRGFQQSVSR
jgi:hypothetical protein